MRWGSDDIGVVLTRNEIWLLLHALAEAKAPAVDWEGNRVEPWVVGELRSRLQAALRPEPLSDVEERPIIRLDSEMGRSLAQAGVRPLVLSDGYDLGSLVAACAERGWGCDVHLPTGAGPMTPAEAVVRAPGGEEFVGLERPVVALARAVIGAGSGQRAAGGESLTPSPRESLTPDPSPDRGTSRTPDPSPDRGTSLTPDPSPDRGRGEDESFEEYVAPAEGINAGERERLVRSMGEQGWELVGEDEAGVRFRRGRG
ncbi:MAG: hypothetical protein KF883_04960 [Thermomicrobiales bacterium]|nr:hypothetical protein [Thermomicrobiales bacterium]